MERVRSVEEACIHHWIIETPNGQEQVQGACRRCGVRRQFMTAGEAPTARDFQMSFSSNEKLAMEMRQME